MFQGWLCAKTRETHLDTPLTGSSEFRGQAVQGPFVESGACVESCKHSKQTNNVSSDCRRRVWTRFRIVAWLSDVMTAAWSMVSHCRSAPHAEHQAFSLLVLMTVVLCVSMVILVLRLDTIGRGVGRTLSSPDECVSR